MHLACQSLSPSILHSQEIDFWPIVRTKSNLTQKLHCQNTKQTKRLYAYIWIETTKHLWREVMYAKYNRNIWFYEFKNFRRFFFQALRHFVMMVVIPIIVVVRCAGYIFGYFFYAPKVMRINENGKRVEVEKYRMDFPQIM